MVEKTIISLIYDMMEKNDEELNISNSTEIASLGLNSITFIKFIVAIEEKFNIEFDDDDLNVEDYKTVNDFSMKVKELCS